MEILNLLNNDAKVDLLGIAPTNSLTMTAEMAHDLLRTKRNCLIKQERENIIRSAKRYIHLEYFKQLITQIYKYNEQGYFLKLGRDTDLQTTETVIARNKCFFVNGDNKALDYLCCICTSQKGRRCRFCDEKDMARFTLQSKQWQYRDHNIMKEKIEDLRLLEIVQIKRNFNRSRQVNKNSISPNETELNNFKEEWCLVAGSNILYTIGDKLKEIDTEHRGNHVMNPPDELHTLLLGALKYCIVWCFDIFYLLQRINNDQYGNIVSQIDENMKYFPRKGSVEPYTTSNMPNGMSQYFTNNRSQSHNQRLAGSLAAMRYPGLIYMLIFCIGFSGSILPQNIDIKHKKLGENLRNSLEQAVRGCNIETIVLNALQSCLHVVSFSRRDEGYTDDHYNLLDKLIAVNRAHMTILFDARNLLRHIVKQNPTIVHKRHLGHKQHLLEHLSDCIRELGPKKIFDTQISENFHLVIKGKLINLLLYYNCMNVYCILSYCFTILELFEACSKNTPAMFLEMCRRHQKRRLIDRFQKEYKRREQQQAGTKIPQNIDNSIPLIKTNKLNLNEKIYAVCNICKRSIASTSNEQEAKLDCGHIYHMNCLRKRLPQRQTCCVEGCRFV